MPSTSMVPCEGSSRKLIQRSKVLLPDPLRPIRQTTSRGWISTEIFLSTCKRPKYLSRLETLTIGGMSAISSCQTSLDAALEKSEDQGHDPIKNGRNDQGFKVMELGTPDPGCAPHNFVHKSCSRYQ